jgi:hypothetical protein
MIDYYNITDRLKTALLAEPFCKTVTKGGIDRVMNAKQDMYPLSHLMINNCSPNGNTLTYNVSILSMDIVDISKIETTDIFVGNDNEDDVLNDMQLLLIRIVELLRRGDLYDEHYTLGSASLEPFMDRFEDAVAGWTLTVDIIVPNGMSIC